MMSFLCRNLLLILLMMGGTAAYATTYTAIASGSYSSSSTWQNGLTPPLISLGNKINIPAAITVTSNNDLSIFSTNNTQGLHVDGKLEMPSSNLNIAGTHLTGNGIINADSIYSDGSSGSNFNFNGLINVNSINATRLDGGNSTATLNVQDLLHVDDTMTLEKGTIHLAAFCMVKIKSFSVNGPAIRADTLTSAGDIDILYTGNWIYTGAELQASGLRNVTILMDNSSGQVVVNKDIIVKGKLQLDTGKLNMGKYDLTLANTADFVATKNRGVLLCNGGDLTINTNTQLTSVIMFGSTSNKVERFTINSGGTVGIRQSLEVTTGFQLIKGKLEIVDGFLKIPIITSAAGYDKDRYIITTNGPLVTDMPANSTFFSPVGTATEYLPYKLTNKNTPYTGVETNVRADVKDGGIWGNTWAGTRPLVNATWLLHPQTAADFDIEVYWFSTAEVNGFDRNKAYISQYNQQWDTQPYTSAKANADGSYSISRKNVGGPTPFAVLDEHTLGINDVLRQQGVSFYPNPASNVVNVDVKEQAKAYLYNTAGQLIQSITMTPGSNTIHIATLPVGLYFVKLTGEHTNASFNFVKQ